MRRARAGYAARVRVLLTNDDGIHSPGLHALAGRLAELGHEVIVAAPQLDMSGASAAIGRLHSDEHIDVTSVPIPGVDGLEGFAVAGPPGLAVMAARLGAFGDPPAVVVSGINTGLNTGHSVLHSGTVGAALTAQSWGASGLAVSLAPTDPWQWRTACDLTGPALAWLIDDAPAATVLNLNVPGLPTSEVKGMRWARLDRFGNVRAAVAESGRNRLQFEFRSAGEEVDPESDTALVLAGYATLTTVCGVTETDTGARPRVQRPEGVHRSLERVPGGARLEIPARPPTRIEAAPGDGSGTEPGEPPGGVRRPDDAAAR